jgi:hypothetical protein
MDAAALRTRIGHITVDTLVGQIAHLIEMGAVQITDPAMVARYSRWLEQLLAVALTGADAAESRRRVAASRTADN